ncbi:MAG TPA: hypothetical protein P5145_02370 [Tenuifilaceae bacterium]|nr:hypothetical protein [Tenuifilaceae bacterium]
MSIVLNTSESKFLERARIALTNAQNHAEIKPQLASFGLDDSKIAEGWAKYEIAKTAWESNQVEDSETKVASNAYKQAYDELESLFKRHRDQAQIFFKKQPDFLVRLGVKGNFPSTYAEFFDKTKAFYTAIQNNADIQKQLLLCKITPEIVTDCLAKHKNLLGLRANFDKEMGESQESTKSKNAQLLDLKEWMDDFDITAKIALYDSPQLLESLGIFVRS